jgi:hypothetical protein
MADLLPPLKPIAIKERLSILFIEKGHLDVLDGAFVVVDNPEQQVRIACRDVFRESKLLERIIPGIEEMLSAGEIAPPVAHEEAVLPAIPNAEGLGDAGHRA